MDINNITLSGLLIDEWYGDSTLVTGAPAGAVKPAPPTAPAMPANKPATPAAPAMPATKPATPSQPFAAQTPAAKPTTPAPPATPIASATPVTYKFLGNNLRRLSIIVDSPGSPFLPDDQLSFLSKILEACRMNIGDVAIVNHHTVPVEIGPLRQQLQPANIVLFGIEPTAIRLPINFPEFKLQPYDQCTYLSAPQLRQLVGNTNDSKLLKSKLWICLKTLFNV